MILAQQAEFKKSQATKLFHLIHQKIPSPRPILTPEQLQQFLLMSNYRNVLEPLPTGLEILDLHGKQMTESHFATSIALHFSTDRVSSYSSFIVFNQSIMSLLLGETFHKTKLYELAKQQFQMPLDDPLALRNYQQLVYDFHEDISYTLEQGNFRSNIEKINYILISIYNSYEDFAQYALERFKYYLRNNVLERAMQSSCLEGMEEECFKFLVIVSEAMRIGEIKQLISTPNYYNREIWQSYLLTMNKFSKKQGHLSTKSIIALYLANLAEDSLAFLDFMLAWLQCNQVEAKQLIVSPLLHVEDPTYITYVTELYIRLLNRKSAHGTRELLPATASIIATIEHFALKVLVNGSQQTCEGAIKLISETVKYTFAYFYSDRDISVLLKALEAREPTLIGAVLDVLQNALKYDNEEIIWMFTRKKSCMEFIKSCLYQPFNETSYHCQCLQILYLLARPEFLNLFQDFKLLETLNNIMQIAQNSYLHTFISHILLKLTKSTCSQQRSLNFLKNRLLLEIHYRLMLSSLKEDLLIDSFLNGKNYLYFNKQIFVNCLHSLFLLNKKYSKTTIKILEKDTNLEYGIKLLDQLIKFFNSEPPQQFLRSTLLQQVALNEAESIKIYKMLFMITEEILYSCKEMEIDIRKEAFKLRNILLPHLYKMLTYIELQTENIPIFLHFEFTTQIDEEFIFRRLLPIKMSYQSIKTYIIEIMKERYLTINIPEIFFREIDHEIDVKCENDYRKLITKVVKNHPLEYRLNLRVVVDQFELSPPRYTPFNQSIQVSPFNQSIQANPYLQSSRSTVNYTPRSDENGSIRSTHSQRNRSPSPFKGTTSSTRFANPMANVCQSCGKVTPANQRLCFDCNRK